MIEYLQMSKDYEPKVIGVRDGTSQLEAGPNFYEKNPWFMEIFGPLGAEFKTKWVQRSEIQYMHNLTDISFRKRGLAADIMQFAGRGYIINEKVREILSGCVLPNHKFFDVVIDNNPSGIRYWWFVYDLEKGIDVVDFEKCEFDFSYNYKYSGGPIIESYEKYMNIFFETGTAIKATKLVFNKNFNKSYDIWGTQFLSVTESYISQHLNSLFVKHKVKGYRIYKPKCELFFE